MARKYILRVEGKTKARGRPQRSWKMMWRPGWELVPGEWDEQQKIG